MSICIDCGICCDGTIFTSVDLDKSDPLDPLLERGARIDFSKLVQPCGGFFGGCCSLYDNRPAVCRTYRCKLLRAHDGGAVSTEQATATIAATKSTRDEVRPLLEQFVQGHHDESFHTMYQRLVAKLETAPNVIDAQAENADLFLALAGLRHLLVSHFEA